MEIWKETFFDNRYEISNEGNLRRNGKILNPSILKIGYRTTVSYKNGVKNQKRYYIHRLVAHHFIGRPRKSMEVNHKDGNKLNNNVSNLEYVTHRENMIHALKIGLINTVRGEKCYHSKLTALKVKRIRSLRRKGNTLQSIANIFNVSNQSIHDVVRGISWRHI